MIDLAALQKLTKAEGRSVEYLNAVPGKEHYRLLAHLSLEYTGKILVEVGTLDGCGALALSYNPANQVITYDVRHYDDCTDFPPNVEKKIVPMDPTAEEYNSFMEEVTKADLIFYDTMHDGEMEKRFVAALMNKEWKGLLILDDINLNEPMKKFWEQLVKSSKEQENQPGYKILAEDWTDIGHWAGTGAVFFSI